MWSTFFTIAAAALFFTNGFAIPSSCPGIAPPRYPYKLAKDWKATKVANNLSSPRGIVVDSKSRLLIVQKGVGISQHNLDKDGCITSSRILISMSALNHGIYFGIDGRTLYASSEAAVFRWAYDPQSGNTTGSPATIVSGMAGQDHISRTLIIPPHRPNLLVVSHGSNSNLDAAAIDPASGEAIVKVFDVSKVPNGGYNWPKDGYNAGYGLRNDVGLAFDGNNMLWGVENSADQLTRTVNGVAKDIHTDNPAEKLNFLGDVTRPNNDWYGYPVCFAIWRPDPAIADNSHVLGTGQQFALAPNATFNDETCARRSVPPRLVFQAHTAPLDAKFDAPRYQTLFVTMHGSWDRNPPVGYKLVAVPFTSRGRDYAYAPVAQPSSHTGYQDVFFPPDEGKCSSTTCARPVGLVFDAGGRLYMTSDTSGEVFVLGH
ncbi:hypothetical protein F4804DRAFT_343800 [Jackrogersella minutella]|nr:hypothetical protein F4804DRAFT_343800 [Jackrogersella minutella]